MSASTATNTHEDIKLEILSPEKIIYRGSAAAVGLPGKLGYMTILPGHATMIAELDSGVLTFSKPGDAEHRYFVAGGFVEVREGNVRVLVDVLEKPSDIDLERAKKSLAKAEERMSGKATMPHAIDYERAGAALKRAQMRIEAASPANRV